MSRKLGWVGLVFCASACAPAESAAIEPGRAAETLRVQGQDLSLRRLDALSAPTLVAARPDGAEVSWRLEERPPQVRVELALAGATLLSVDDDGLHLAVDGRRITFGHGTFIDAKGVRTAVPAQWVRDRIVLAVDDAVVARAAYPAILDPTISAEIEVSTPTKVELPGTSAPADVVGAGSDRWLFAQASFGGVTHTRAMRLPSTVGDGDVVTKQLGDITVRSVATGGSQMLVLGTVGDDVSFVRLALDGTRMDTAPVRIARGIPIAAAWDGTRFLVAWKTAAFNGTTHAAHVTTAGVVAEPTGFLLEPQSGSYVTDVACVGASCLAVGPIASYLIGASGVTGTADAIYTGRVVAGTTGFFALTTGSDLIRPAWVTSSGTANIGARLDGYAARDPYEAHAAVDASGAMMALRNDDRSIGVGRFASGVTTATWLAKVATNASGPARVASDGSKATLLWADAAQKVVSAQFDVAATPGSVAGTPLGRSAPAQYEAAMASDGKDLFVAWTEERGRTFEVRARKLSATGAPLSPETVVATTSTRFSAPAASWDGTRWVVAFRRHISIDPYAPSGLQLVRVGADGAVVDTTPKEVESLSGVYASPPVLASAAGTTLVAWIDGAGLRVRRIDAAGAFVDAAPRILGLADVKGISNNAVGVAPAMASDGKTFLVTWPLISDAARDVVGAIVDPAAPLPTTSFAIAASSGYQQNPGVAWDGARYLVAWTEQRQGASFAVRALRVDAAGKPLDAAPITVLTEVCDTCAPRVAYDGATFVVAALRPVTGSPAREVALARVRRDGVVVTETPWSLTKTAQLPFRGFLPVLASDGHGTSMIASAAMIDDDAYATMRIRLRAFAAKAPIGGTCTATSDCDAGTCVDGICCKTGCVSACEACDLPGSLGECVPVVGKPHGMRTCGGAATDPCAQGACDGKDVTKCSVFALEGGATCAAPRCDGTTFIAAGLCSAARSCTIPTGTDCAPYRCAATGCSKLCTTDEQCAAPARCVEGSCVPSTTNARCTDDRLSSVPKDGVPQSCAPFKCDTDGACATACVTSEDCIVGFACDGAKCVLPEVPPAEEGGCSMTTRASSTSPFALLAMVSMVSAIARRRRVATRRLALAGAVASVACRASSPDPVLAQRSEALTISAESSSTDSQTTGGGLGASAVACNAAGCLVVSYDGPWLVGTRLAADGSLASPSTVVIAPSLVSGFGDTVAIPPAVATDGTDYFVAWSVGRQGEGFAQNYGVRVGADGKALDAPTRIATTTAFYIRSFAAGWDGKSYLFTWQESAGGVETVANVWGARIGKDGARLDPTGFPVITLASTDPSDASLAMPSMSCDAAGCIVAAAIETGPPVFFGPPPPSTSSRIVRVADGKVAAGPFTATLPITDLARSGSQTIAVGRDADGIHAMVLGADGAPTTTRAKLGPTLPTVRVAAVGSELVAIAGTPAAFGFPGPASLYRFTPTLTVSEGPIAITAATVGDPATIGGTVIVPTGAGALRLTPSPLAAAPLVAGTRGVPHQHLRMASDGKGNRLAAWVSKASGTLAVRVAKVSDAGVLAPASGTLVAEEAGSESAEVAVGWDGTRFVVAWRTSTSALLRVAAARVDTSGVVLDVATVYTSTNDASLYGGIEVAGDPSGTTIIVPEIQSDPKLGLFRLDADAKPVSATPVSSAPLRFRTEDVSAVRVGSTTYVAYVEFATGELFVLSFGSDGAQIGAPRKIVSAAGKRMHPALAASADGKLHVAYSDTRPDGLLSDIWLATFASDLSDVPTTPMLVSARDAEQIRPAIAIDGARAVVAFREPTNDTTEVVRASWIDLASKALLVDAATLFTVGNGELNDQKFTTGVPKLELSTAAPNKYVVGYLRRDPDPAVLALRAKTRAFSFGALNQQDCATGADCENGFCVDGVCCDRACEGTCEACNEPGKKGVCTTVAGAPRAARTCGTSGVCGEGTCDGFDATKCAKFTKGLETSCAAATCAGALFTAPAFCSGTGTCAVPEKQSCAPYVCDPNGCLTSCTADTSCAAGFACKDGACVTKELTATCSADGLSSRGVDGVEKSCAPFRCGATGTCLTRCTSSLECGPALSCEVTSGTCAGAAPSEDGGGCSVAGSTHPNRSAPTWLFGLSVGIALWSAARARRSSRGRFQPLPPRR